MKGFATVIALAAALTVPAVATADSVTYIKDGNVWLTSPDASKQYQLTFDGGYSSPSQASNGTIGALHNEQFARLDRSGHKLSEIALMGSDNSVPNFYGPFDARISPDGSKVAYWYGLYTSYFDYGCACSLWHVQSATTWSRADQFDDPNSAGDYYWGLEQPEWLTGDRLLAAYPYFWQNIWTYKIGTGTGYVSGAAQWWASWQDDQSVYFDMGDPALSPDGTKLALTDLGDATNNTRLAIASVGGPAWAGEPPYANDFGSVSAVQPQPVLQCFRETGVIRNPSWSSDSNHLAYALPDGIHLMDATNYKDSTTCPSDQLLVAGGSEPAFGPKDVDLTQKPAPPAPTDGSTGSSQPGGSGSPTPTAQGGGTTPPPAFTLGSVTLKPAAFRAATSGPAIARRSVGTTLSFTVSAASKVTLTVTTAKGKPIRGAIKTAAKPGVNKLRFMGRVARKALRPGRYRLAISATPLPGGTPRLAQVAFRIVR